MIDTSKITLTFKDVPADVANGGTISVLVTHEEGVKPGDVLAYLSSGAFRKDIENQFVTKHAPACGMSLHGGPRPVFADPQDRSSGVTGYEQDVSLVKWG